MKCQLSIQEKLKDLSVEKGLSLEELAAETGLSKSALGSYEKHILSQQDQRYHLQKENQFHHNLQLRLPGSI